MKRLTSTKFDKYKTDGLCQKAVILAYEMASAIKIVQTVIKDDKM